MKQMQLNNFPTYVTVREMLDSVSVKFRGKVAYSYRKKPSRTEATKVTFEEVREDVARFSTSILANGLGRKHVALIGKLSYPWICAYLSLLACGAVVVPLDADWTEEDLAATVERADCEALFCSDDIMRNKAPAILKNEKIRIALSLDEGDGENNLSRWIDEGECLRRDGDRSYENERLHPGELAMLAFTSGTTGKGKGVMLSQTAILDDVASVLQIISATPKTIGLLPAHHTFGSNLNLIGHLCHGSEMYLSSGVRYLLKELKEQKPGHLILVPLFLESFRRKIQDSIREKKLEKEFATLVKVSNALRKTGVDIRRRLFKGILDTFGGELSLVVSGGAPLSPSLVKFFDNIGITILNGYGITECAPVIAANLNKRQKEGSVGMVLPLDTIKIRQPNPQGEGEICVKGNNVMLGYYKDPEATEAAFDEDGYFRTGDIGKLDEEGWLYITGRMKNLIILSNGKNVYPEEIETTLSAIPGVAEVVVYEGESRRGVTYNTVVAEIFPDEEFIKKNGIENTQEYFQPHIQDYNRSAVPYKKIGLLKVRTEDFPKNTLRKIMRFKIDKTID